MDVLCALVCAVVDQDLVKWYSWGRRPRPNLSRGAIHPGPETHAVACGKKRVVHGVKDDVRKTSTNTVFVVLRN